jgi:hypothetical protein
MGKGATSMQDVPTAVAAAALSASSKEAGLWREDGLGAQSQGPELQAKPATHFGILNEVTSFLCKSNSMTQSH